MKITDDEVEDVCLGTIIGLQGSYMSGLATLIVEDEIGMAQYIHCDNSQTVRSLENAFGNVIGEAHNIKEYGGHIGKKVFYFIDMFDVLEWFIPYDEAPDELVEIYNRLNDIEEFIPNYAV